MEQGNAKIIPVLVFIIPPIHEGLVYGAARDYYALRETTTLTMHRILRPQGGFRISQDHQQFNRRGLTSVYLLSNYLKHLG